MEKKRYNGIREIKSHLSPDEAYQCSLHNLKHFPHCNLIILDIKRFLLRFYSCVCKCGQYLKYLNVPYI